MAREATSWDWLRAGITKTLPRYSLLERVENGVNAGTADVNYLVRAAEGWIELKAVPLPKRASTPVLGREGLNIDQINWHIARQCMGGRTWVFISAQPYRWLLSGAYARNMNEWTAEELTAKARVWAKGNWKAGDWEALVRALGSS
jgi:hypothetical protein